MPTKQSYAPNAIGSAGVVYGFDPVNTNLTNALKVSADGSLAMGGQSGARITKDTVAVTGSWTAITMLNDTVFASFTETGASGGSIVGLTLPAGMTLFGKVTGYQLTSGAVRAYNM